MLIELSEFNFKLFIPLIYPIFKRLQDFTKKTYIIKDNHLFKTFRYFFSYIFSFIFLLIIFFRTRKNKEGEQKDVSSNMKTKNGKYIKESNKFLFNEIMELKEQNIKKKRIKSYLFLLLLSAVGFCSYFYRKLFKTDNYGRIKQSLSIILDIGLYTLLSIIILKQKLYKHSYASIGLMGAILILLFIISLYYTDSDYILPGLLYYFLHALLFGLYDVLGKKYMILYFSTPYFLMVSVSIIVLVFLLIYDVIAYYLNPDISGVIEGFQKNIISARNFFLFLSDVLIQFIWNLGIWLTIYYLTPCHYFISSYIAEYFNYIVSATSSDDDFYSTINIIVFSISYFINFFCCLVFNEVIILNFCNLDYNTAKRIKERIKEEALLCDKSQAMSDISDNDFNSSFEKISDGQGNTSSLLYSYDD